MSHVEIATITKCNLGFSDHFLKQYKIIVQLSLLASWPLPLFLRSRLLGKAATGDLLGH